MNIEVLNKYYSEIGSTLKVHSTEKCFIIYEVFDEYIHVTEAYTMPEYRGDKEALSELYNLMSLHEKTKAVCFVGLNNKNLNINTLLYLSRGAKIMNTNDDGISFLFEIKE